MNLLNIQPPDNVSYRGFPRSEMEWIKLYYHLIGTAYIVLVITAAHLLSVKPYSWGGNSISDLGSQGYTRGWIMRAGYIGFGVIIASGIVLKMLDKDILYLVDIPVLLYGLAMFFAGVFSSEPLSEGVRSSETQHVLHITSVMLAGISLCIALLMSALLAPDRTQRTIHVFTLILVTLTSGLLGFREKYNAVAQRLLYLVSFLWLAFVYNA